MHIDSKELHHVAAAGAARVDMYTGIHKAIRALMADTLLAVGRMDVDDEPELAQVTQRVLELLEFCASHVKHENDFVHAAIEARAPGASQAIAQEHEEHLQHLARLAAEVAGVRAAGAAQRPAAAERLYRALALFIAENFQHMHVEETAHNQALWAHYTDAELGAVHDALVASIPPQEMAFVVRWLLPFMNPAERAGLAADMRAKMPAPAFEGVLDSVRPAMSEREWAKLMRALGMAPAPGLVTA